MYGVLIRILIIFLKNLPLFFLIFYKNKYLIDFTYIIQSYFFLLILCSVITTYIYFLKNYINYNNFVYVYLNFVYLLFLISIALQYLSLVSDFSYVYSFDFTKIINNSNIFVVAFEFDNISCFFSSVTVQISFFSNVYSYFYNKKDYNNFFFFTLLNLFFLSMVFLIHSKNLIILFFFWEMIGLTSFFLINFYFYKTFTFKSAMKAFSFNKISDMSLLTSIVIFYNINNSFNICQINIYNIINNSFIYKNVFFSINSTSLFLIFLSSACFVKSAQLGFHFWLPDSMEAPLPASALIHSATLVAAGIYLLSRFSYVFNFNSNAHSICTVYFIITFLYGAAVSSSQTDVKKILAYSTISNCGLMFLSFICGSTITGLVFFALHGWYKSISFLISGQLVIMSNHTQDMRRFYSRYYNSLLQTSHLTLTILSLSSFWFMYNSLVKHLIFQNKIYSIALNSSLMVGSVFSYMYGFRILFFFISDKFLIKNKQNFFNIYEVYNSIIYLLFISLFYYKYAQISGFYQNKELNKILINLNLFVIFNYTYLKKF